MEGEPEIGFFWDSDAGAPRRRSAVPEGLKSWVAGWNEGSVEFPPGAPLRLAGL
jgi:hypothetical protein